MDALTKKIAAALLLLIAVAIAARLAWELLHPLLPAVIALLVIVAILSVVIRRRGSW